MKAYVAAMAEDSPIQVAEHADGTVLYHLPFAPSDLPPVFGRDLDAAWDASREAALQARPGAVRLFRFAGHAVLALSDRDARCWAASIDRTVGLGSAYGVSLLLRLLSLVDLLARAPWLSGSFTLCRSGVAELSPALLRAVSACRITGDARLDEVRLRDALALCGALSGVPA